MNYVAIYKPFVLITIITLTHVTQVHSDSFLGDTEIKSLINNLPANSWSKLNTNEYQDVWTPLDQRTRPDGGTVFGSPANIIRAWSSFAWDSNRGDLIIYGGGHANYPGNDVYRWRASTFKWERASLPSETVLVPNIEDLIIPVDGVDNAPSSAHTYDNSSFLPVADRFVTFGGALYNTAGPFQRPDGSDTGPYFWDPAKADGNKVGGTTGSHVNPQKFPNIQGGNMWSNRNNIKDNLNDNSHSQRKISLLNGTTAYAEENGKDVVYLQHQNNLWRYIVNDVDDSSQDVYELVGRTFDSFHGKGAGAIDTKNNLYVRNATNTFTFWSLENEGEENKNKNFLPDVLNGDEFDFAKLIDYGLDYDSKRERFTLWGGEDVWALTPPEDILNDNWTLDLIFNGTAGPSLGDFPFIGVLGKWKYIEDLDIFLGLIDPFKGDIWAYKPEDFAPIPLPAALPLFSFSLLISLVFRRKNINPKVSLHN